MSAALQQRWIRVPELALACRRVLAILVLGVLPALLVLAVLIGSYRSGTGAWAIDFDGNFLVPAQEIVHGLSPYHADELARARHAVAAGRQPDEFMKGVFVTYPAPTLLIGVPFTYLPLGLAEWLWVGLMVAGGALALRLVGVRDWRVYGAALLTPALAYALLYGAMDCLLMLGLAALWRWRDHAWRGGAALGAIIALKLIFVPLLAWLVLTRRFGAALRACGVASASWLAGWALIGFHGLSDYPRLISLLSDVEKTQGYSSVAYARTLGFDDGTASGVPYVLGACLIVVLWRVLRRRGAHADAHAFLLGVLAVMAFSPIVWQHYLTLLLVPLAVLRPRLSVAWFVPCLLWLTPFAAFNPGGTIQQIVFAVVVIGTAVFAFGPAALVSRSFRPSSGTGRLPAWR